MLITLKKKLFYANDIGMVCIYMWTKLYIFEYKNIILYVIFMICLHHRWELTVIHDHKIVLIYPYPFLCVNYSIVLLENIY